MKLFNRNGLKALKEEFNRIIFDAGYEARLAWDSRPRPIESLRGFFAETDRQLTEEHGDDKPLETEET